MTSAQIARKDFEDAVRSRMIWAAVAVFVVLMGIIGASAATNDLSAADPTLIITLFANIGGQLLVPIIALMIGYMAIVGERQSGSLRVLFGLSHDRRDVFVGKLASRIGVILVATLVACVVAVVMALVLFDSVPVATFLGFVAITLLLGAAFTAIAVGVSAATESRMQAMGGAIGSFVSFTMLWHPLVAGIHYLLEGELAGLEAPNWYFFLLRLNPLEAYTQVSSSLADEFILGLFGWATIIEDVPASTLQDPNALLLSNRVAGDLPFYLTDWFAAVTMLVWVVVPAYFGYRSFRGADLN
jgi:ABC-2 type transport system permease protein